MDQLGLCLQLKEARRHVQYRAGSAKRIYTHASPSSSYVACDPRLSWSPEALRQENNAGRLEILALMAMILNAQAEGLT